MFKILMSILTDYTPNTKATSIACLGLGLFGLLMFILSPFTFLEMSIYIAILYPLYKFINKCFNLVSSSMYYLLTGKQQVTYKQSLELVKAEMQAA